MANLLVVPFDDEEGRLEGDSSWNSAISFPYVDGMTVEQVREAALTKLMNIWEESDIFDTVADFAAEYQLSCSGGWVIEKEKLDIINSWDIEIGGDSQLYAMMASLKSQVASNATKVIE